MFRRIWNYLSDHEEAVSGLVVISSIVMACAGLAVAVTI